MPEFNLKYPVIPENEFPERWKGVQEMMSEMNLELAPAYADDRQNH